MDERDREVLAAPALLARDFLDPAHRRSFNRGEVVFHQGDPADCMHLITEGMFAAQVAAPEGAKVTLGVMAPGQFFGELGALREGHHRIATVFALERGETAAIGGAELTKLRRHDPEVTDLLLRGLAEKMTRYTARVLEALHVSAETRVIRRLLELAALYRTDGDASITITQQTLADLAGTSRATVNRVLRREQERGTLTLARRRIEIVDGSRLTARAARGPARSPLRARPTPPVKPPALG